MANIGGNVRLGRNEIEQALKKRVIEILKGRGNQIDELDFMNRVTIHYGFLKTDESPVTFDSTTGTSNLRVDTIYATWEE